MAIRLHRPCLLSAALITLLTGCLGHQGPKPQFIQKVSLPPAGLPHYTPGARYQFDNGRLETVYSTDGDKVTWKIGRKGTTEIRYRNPAMPPVQRSTRKLTAEAMMTAPPDSLWPLRAGNSVRFTERRSLIKATGESKRSRRAWSCSVDDAVRLHTKAGVYDSFPIECSRQSNSRSMRWLETKRWYYAPSVGHYVRYEHERRRKPAKVYELVAVGDADSWRAAPDPELAAIIQPALEHNRSDEPLTKVVEAGYRVRVTPIETWRNGTGQYCRDYVVETGTSRLQGAACRRMDGIWGSVKSD